MAPAAAGAPASGASKRRGLGLGAAAVLLALDQASKFWAIGLLEGPPPVTIPLTPFLSLALSWNRGIAYTMLRANSDLGRYALVGVALAAALTMAVLLWRARSVAGACGLGLLIGGALGNAADRIMRGAVADFLYFHTPFSLGPLSNYIFNLADAGIVAGVALLLYESVLTPEAEKA